MTQPQKLEVGDMVRFNDPRPQSYGRHTWNGWQGFVISVDNETTPFQFIKVKLIDPHNDDWEPITWAERHNLTKLPK